MNQKILGTIRDPKNGEELIPVYENKNEFLQNNSGRKYPIRNNLICLLDKNELSGNNKKYQNLYDNFSRFYDLITHLTAWVKSGGERKRLMQYLSEIEIKDTDRVIEISIGTGRNIKYLNSNAEYYGVDISLGMLDRCRRKMKKMKRQIVLLQSEAEFLPITDNSFDVVFSAGGFNFFNDPGKAVLEMLRIAKSGTKLLITDETEKLRAKYERTKFGGDFYKTNKIKKPTDYLPEYCKNIEYKEICDGDLYVLTFTKP